MNLRDFAAMHNWCCYWCHRRVHISRGRNGNPDSPLAATREHLVPRSLKKKGVDAELVLACFQCNSIRGHMSESGFRDLMAGKAVLKSELWPHLFTNPLRKI